MLGPAVSDSPSQNTDWLTLPGRSFLALLAYLGELGVLLIEVFYSITSTKPRLRLMAEQLVTIGYGSQVVVVVTGAFTGAVFAAQIYMKFTDFGLESAAGGIVSVALCRELAPSLAALMVTGRVGAAMAAEIGTMKVTEQIDALRVMGVHPVDYLVTPRFLAMLISLPLLIAECIVFGICAAAFVTVQLFGVPAAWFWAHLYEHTAVDDLIFADIKGVFFAVIIVIISCHQGLAAENGAVGVGRGTTQAVVFSSLTVLISNFFLTLLLSYFFPMGSGV